MNFPSIKLSEKGIEMIQKLECPKKETIKVDLVLQVYTTKKNEQQNKANFMTVGLADMSDKYSGFLIVISNDKPEPQVGDILKITGITVAALSKDKSQNTKIFLVKTWEILAFKQPFLSSPEAYENKIKKETLQLQYKNPNANSFDCSNCQLLSHLTTFSKEIHLYAKVIKKSEVRNFKNRTNGQQGKLFTFNIIDIEGFEMQVTAFGDTCDKLFNIINENDVYEIFGGYVKINDKKFSNVKSDYKLVFDNNTKISKVPDNGMFKEVQSHFVKFQDIPNMTLGALIDCVAVITDLSDRATINTKNGEQNVRRIKLGDASGYKIEVTLWRQFAEYDLHENDIIVVKSARIGDYNGRNLGSVDTTELIVNPNIPEVNELREYLMQGNIWKPLPSTGTTSDSNTPIDFSYIKDIMRQLDNTIDDKSIGLSKFKATVCTFNNSEKNFYPGCPEKTCKKKLIQDMDGKWTCHGCNKDYEKPYYYYTLSAKVKDASGEHWIDIFGELGHRLLGVTAEEYKDLILNKDDTKLKDITDKIEFKTFNFIGKAKTQIYNGMEKKRLNVYRYEEIDKGGEARRIVRFLNTVLLNKV